jgi:hypothetical protein
MKKYFTSFIFILLFMPAISFAQTSASNGDLMQLLNSLLQQVQVLQQQMAALQENKEDGVKEETLRVIPGKIYESYSKRFYPGIGGIREGRYNISFQVIAGEDALYIPVSFGSGTTTGFVYEIESSGKATTTSTITCKGAEIKTSTIGSLSFCKIPAGKTADVKVIAKIVGEQDEDYRIIINRINYKTDPNKLKYSAFKTNLSTGVVEFK